jgi:hypothetical protein
MHNTLDNLIDNELPHPKFWPTGITAATKRSSTVALVMPGLVSQTIRSRGGIFRRARMRSRQLAGASDLGGCGLKDQFIGYSGLSWALTIEERGQRPRSSTLSACFTGPCSSQGDVYGRIRFDGNAPAKIC